MKPLSVIAPSLLAASLAVLLTGAAGDRIAPRPAAPADTARVAAAVPQVDLDLDRAVVVKLPDGTSGIAPAAFRTADGRDGWVIHIPGGRPIATPAYAGGLLFVGGGYGSHEFYAFDAGSGALAWQIKTSDDGPTAAVVEDGCVAFNTESCTVMVVDARTGRLLWQEWLGDPLMSQPAIADGRLFMDFPANGRGPSLQSGSAGHAAGDAPPGWSHRLLCADLRTGAHRWVCALPAPVVTAPVVEGDRVYLACFDGTSMVIDAATGRTISQRNDGATSAPMVAGGEVSVTARHFRGGRASEILVVARPEAKGTEAHGAAPSEPPASTIAVETPAPYLETGSKGSVLVEPGALHALDTAVGFAAPQASAMAGAKHLNVTTVAGGWAYQGSRAAFRDGRILNAQGAWVNCVASAGGRARWQARAHGNQVDANAQLFAPPALGERNVYLCSGQGHVVALRQHDGAGVFAYAFGRPMAFQPALAQGNLYAGTSDGLLVCLRTGDRDADGWYAWGGNSRHNKTK